MKWIAVVLAVVVVAGAALAWTLSAPRPRYSAEAWQTLGLAGDAAAGRLVFYAGGCEVLSQVAGPGRSFKAWRRARTQDAVRLVLPAEYLHRSGRRDRRLAPGRCRQRAPVGRFSKRRPSLPRLPLHVLSAHDPEGCRRSRGVPAHLAGGQGQSAGERPPLSLLHPPRCGLVEAPLISTMRASAPIPRKANNGTAAAISSRAPAIAANATRRGGFWARWT